MKIQYLKRAAMLEQELKAASEAIGFARGVGLGITLAGKYQDEALLDRVRPHIIEVLTERYDAVIRQLSLIGVVVEDPSEAPAGD